MPLSREIQDRVGEHPCFSRGAHFQYGRLHLPVAPSCNIQCAYCDRRFDCPNESRPGVSSTILTPEQALQRVEQALCQAPELRVIGIAGPGDPHPCCHGDAGTAPQIVSPYDPLSEYKWVAPARKN